MRDIVADFMDRLRLEWPEVPVVAEHAINTPSNVMGICLQKWVQRPEGCDVNVKVSYFPPDDAPMQAMLQWLEKFYALIHTTDPIDVFTQWWGQNAEFSSSPLQINCTVTLRYSNEVV